MDLDVVVNVNDAGIEEAVSARVVEAVSAAFAGGVAAHTHQAVDITDLTEAVQDIVGAMIVQGTNVSASYNDAAGQLTIAAAAGGSGGKLVGWSYAEVTNVITGTNTMNFDDNVPVSGAGVSAVSTPYQATSTNNRLKISINAVAAHSAFQTSVMGLFREGTCILAVPFSYPGTNYINYFNYTALLSAPDTSNHSYSVRIGSNGAGTTTINGVSSARRMGGLCRTNILIEEIAP